MFLLIKNATHKTKGNGGVFSEGPGLMNRDDLN